MTQRAEHNESMRSIWGSWWEPFRKWFYAAWLMYETLIRFYDYSLSVHYYFEEHQHEVALYIGAGGALALDVLCSVAAFAGCAIFLTVPACFVLYAFFKNDNLTGTRFEEKLKPLF